MDQPKWLADGALCRSCGACCFDVSNAPLEGADVPRLNSVHGPHATTTLFRIVDGSALMNVNKKTGACHALSSTNEGYCCHVYNERPEICRTFRCFVLQDLEEYYAKGGPLMVPAYNMFHRVTPHDMFDATKAAMRAYRSVIRRQHSDTPVKEQPDFYPALLSALMGKFFKNTFPPKAVRK